MRIIKMSLVVQWLRVHASTVGGMVLFPGWGAKILQGHMPCDEAKKKKKKELCKVVNIRNSQTWLHIKNHLERFHLPVKIKEKNFTLSVKSKEVWI